MMENSPPPILPDQRPRPPGWQRVWLQRALGAFSLALVGVTWRLWTPQTVFPQVPWLAMLNAWPAGVQWAGLAAILLASLALVALPRRWGGWNSCALACYAAAMSGMILLDQQRLEPWAFQFVTIAVLLAALPTTRSLWLLRLLTASLYFYSALSKFDYTFLNSLGQDFLQVLAGKIGFTPATWPESSRLMAAAFFPLGELSVAIGLLLPISRRVALVCAIGMHLLLLMILGPWGLQHGPSVLVWNVFLMLLDVLLFGWPIVLDDMPVAVQPPPRGFFRGARIAFSAMAILLSVAELILPPLAWFEVYDHWPAWGLYSPKAQRTIVLVRVSEVPRLPPRLQKYCVPPDAWDDIGYLHFKLDRWSLDALGAPLYPQNRTQLAISVELAKKYDLPSDILVRRLGVAAPLSGLREKADLDGQDAIEAAADVYWLNARAKGNLK